MERKHWGKTTLLFTEKPSIVSRASVVGKKEGQGPLGKYFDYVGKDTQFGQNTWEKSERKMQELALDIARKKIGLHNAEIDLLFAGDLLNQCVTSSFSLRDTGIPFAGVYGACSTMAESLMLAAMAVDGGYAQTAAAMTSSHFASAERQYRFPLSYGGQRTPTAQWTVTGAGCVLVQNHKSGPCLECATVGQVIDLGIKDANNMGAAMAPAAYHTISKHLQDMDRTPEAYDLILTGDLGAVGSALLKELFRQDGTDLSKVHMDCGCMIYDGKKQDVHAGGSGCGCSAVTLCSKILGDLEKGKLDRILFCATGALLSPLTSQQGESVPGICHAISICKGE